METAKIKPACNQVEFHPFLYQKKLYEYCESLEIKIISFSPLARGKLKSPPYLLESPDIIEIAKSLGEKVTPAQVILNWIMQKGIPVIPRTSNLSRMAENFDSLLLQLSQSQITKIDSLNINKRTALGWLNDQFIETIFENDEIN